MASYNRVILMGNLTRDPELRTLGSGAKVAKMGLAVSESWRDRSSGESREITTFVDIDVWERQAELCAKYLSKGRAVLVEGRLRMDSWETKEGEKRSKLTVRADSVRFVGPAPQRDEGGGGAAAVAASVPPNAPPAMLDGDDSGDDEDLPF